ncbi:MAG: hypothetical protein Q8P15_00245 [Nanoarchaeota archaeon]|nr:hypothetical protein [Nanoarchaeota archaeon]
MLWRWFKRKSESSSQNLSNDPRWASLAASLKYSFSHVKEDINHLTTHNSEQDKKIEQISLHLQKLESRLDNLFIGLTLTNNHKIKEEIPVPEPIRESQEESQEVSKKTILNVLENLTDVQRSILMTLAQVTKEIPSGWISLKDLAAEIYPNKKYNDVRTMMSEYTDKLLDFGLINKKRRGREVVLSLTNKTKQISMSKEVETKNKDKRK